MMTKVELWEVVATNTNESINHDFHDYNFDSLAEATKYITTKLGLDEMQYPQISSLLKEGQAIWLARCPEPMSGHYYILREHFQGQSPGVVFLLMDFETIWLQRAVPIKRLLQ